MKKIEIVGLRKSYPRDFTLDNLTFDVLEKEIFAFIGPNGSGKTTTVRMLLGLISPDSGYAKIVNDGFPITPAKVGFTLEDEKPFEYLTPLEYLEFFGAVYDLDLKKDRYSEVLEWLRIPENSKKPCGVLSKGTQRKLCLAKTILLEPDVLILDEPIDGIEPETRREIKDHLLSFTEANRIVFITSHNLYELEHLCSSFGIILNGHFLGKWDMNEIRKRNLPLEEFYLEKVRICGEN
jgi:ABC-2 type transport system ATP-binding protein